MTTMDGTARAQRRAVIDIGTVSTRLLVADELDGKVETLVRETTITNLGVGVSKTGVLTKEGMGRVAETARRYAAAIEEAGIARDGDAFDPHRVIAIATSAARDAQNGNELVEALASCGITLLIIPGDLEAKLSFSGATSDFAGDGLLVHDIGGGSTELIFGSSHPDAPGVIEARHSFDIGCRRVTEMFLASDPPAAGEMGQASRWILDQVVPYLERFRGRITRIIGVAGTSTSMVSMNLALEVYDSSKVHGQTLTRADVQALRDRLASLDVEGRRHVTGLNPKRAEVIVAGALILDAVLEAAGADEFTVSEADNLAGTVLNWPYPA